MALDKKYFTNSKDANGEYKAKDKSLLLVIDIQPKLMVTMENGDRVTKNTLGLIKAFKKYGIDIIATEQYPKGLGRLDEDILEELDEEKIFPKTSFNALIPEVKDYIKNEGIEKVFVVGSEGHVCVYQTIRSLIDLGLDVYYIDDAIASFSEKLKNIARASLIEMGSVLTNTEVVLFDLAGDSKDEHFKFISNLVKDLRK